MQFIDLLLVRWIFWGQIGHKNYEDFEHPTLRGTIYGRDEVAHVPTAALLRSLQWVSLYRSRSAEPAAHTRSAGRSWVRGYGGTP